MTSRKKYPVSLLPCGIAPAMPHKLYRIADDGQPVLATSDEIKAAAMVRALKDMTRQPVLTAPANVRTFLVARMRELPCEVFAALLLDNRHRLIEYREMFRGTIDGASVHPREVVREVMACNAAAVIFAHNHPSGVAEASQADELITRRLRDALSLIDVRVLDHLIVGDSACLSFAERGLL